MGGLNRECYDGIVLKTTTDATCAVQCDEGYTTETLAGTEGDGSVTCASNASPNDAVTASISCVPFINDVIAVLSSNSNATNASAAAVAVSRVDTISNTVSEAAATINTATTDDALQLIQQGAIEQQITY